MTMTAAHTKTDRLSSLESFARQEMRKHLGSGWEFRWDRAVKRAGRTNFDGKIISFSKPLADINSDSEFMDTVYHEVAHALAGFDAGHGPLWRHICLSLGGNGYTTHDMNTPQGKYVGVCPSGHSFYRHRMTKKRKSCSKCSAYFNPEYLLEWRLA